MDTNVNIEHSPLVLIPFKPYPLGKTRLKKALASEEQVIRVQKSLIDNVIRTIDSLMLIKNTVIITPLLEKLEKMISLDKYPFLSVIAQQPEEVTSKSLGEQISEIVCDLEIFPVILVMSDLVNLRPSTIKAVHALLKEYDGVIVPTNDKGTGILGFNEKLCGHLNYFGKNSSEKFFEVWDQLGSLRIARFIQQPELIDVDTEEDLKLLKWDFLKK